MQFPGKLRKVGGSLMVTVPLPIVEKLGLKEDMVEQFEIKKEAK